MVHVIIHLAINRPVIYMHIEEIHVYRDLHTFTLEMLWLIYLLYNYNFTVSNGCHDVISRNEASLRDSEEKERESHKRYRENAQQVCKERNRNKAHHQICQWRADYPY
jgi:hypothetical protein